MREHEDLVDAVRNPQSINNYWINEKMLKMQKCHNISYNSYCVSGS